jgi:hypothetical protein
LISWIGVNPCLVLQSFHAASDYLKNILYLRTLHLMDEDDPLQHVSVIIRCLCVDDSSEVSSYLPYDFCYPAWSRCCSIQALPQFGPECALACVAA